jgi:GNAT superfamily N-acetyltransferase
VSDEPVEIRDDPPDGPAARALFEQYMEFIRARVGLPGDMTPPEHIFATADVFDADGAAWLVAFDAAGEPAGCGGLRVLEPGLGEIKRMFVSPRLRGSGLGRRLLRELERRALLAGMTHVRLLTTELLRESRALYAAEGYREIRRVQRDGGPVEIWLEKALARPRHS